MQFASKLFALIVVCALCTSGLIAGGDECQKACDKAGKAACTEGGSCTLSAGIAKSMPQWAVLVGDKTFECPMAAAEVAKKEGKSIVYLVAGKKFDNQEKAMVAYADALDTFVTKFTSVRTMEECMAECAGSSGSACSDSAKASCDATKVSADAAAKSACCEKTKDTGVTGATGDAQVALKSDAKGGAKVTTGGECRSNDSKATNAKAVFCVAGQCFDSKDKAVKAAQVVTVAIKDVNLGYRVGSKNFYCDKMAGDEAAKTSQQIVFVVGENTTQCKVTARITLAKARLAAAAKALEAKAITKA